MLHDSASQSSLDHATFGSSGDQDKASTAAGTDPGGDSVGTDAIGADAVKSAVRQGCPFCGDRADPQMPSLASATRNVSLQC